MNRVRTETAQRGNPGIPELAIPTFTEKQLAVVAESDRDWGPPPIDEASVEEPLPLER
jgi:hypothetical protein